MKSTPSAREAITQYASNPENNFRLNPVQLDYADHIERGICASRATEDGGQLFAEAETGTGKTIAYLVALGLNCVRRGERAIVATHTIALQNQIFQDGGDKDIALRIIEQSTGTRLRLALRVGRRNFIDTDRTALVCERKRNRLKGSGKGSDEDLSALDSLEQWALRNPGEMIGRYLEAYTLDALPCGLIQEDICINVSTSKSGASYKVYREHVLSSHGADIVVTNHAMLVANSVVGRNRVLHDPNDRRRIGALLVDEADRLPSAAQSMTSDLLPIREFVRAVEAWGSACTEVDGAAPASLKPLLRALAGLHEHMEGMRESVNTGAEEVQFWTDLSFGSRKDLLDDMRAILRELPQARSTSIPSNDPRIDVYSDFIDYCGRFSSLFSTLMQKDEMASGRVVALRWSPDRHYPSFRIFRLHPARVLKSMWSRWVHLGQSKPPSQDPLIDDEEQDDNPIPSLILTSATLTAPTLDGSSRATDIQIAYGVHNPSNACAGINAEGKSFSPQKFGSAHFVFSDPEAPDVYLENVYEEVDFGDALMLKINPDWVGYQVHAVRRAMERGGRILVLTNSYRATGSICAALRDAGIDVIEKTRANSAASCKTALAQNPSGVYVTPSAWEGFDMSLMAGPDGRPLVNALRHVIVTQLPWPSPDGAMSKALFNHLIRRGKTEAIAKQIVFGNQRADALRRFKQGFGRGIRSIDAEFTLWLTDPRFPRSAAAHELLPAARRCIHEFKNAIPKRFRSGSFGSAWDRGDVLMANGDVIEPFDMALGLAM